MFVRLCLLGSILTLAACGSSSGSAPTSPSVATTVTTGSTATSTASIEVPAPDPATGEYGVAGKGSVESSFSPGTVTISVGGTVSWKNNDVTSHTTTATGGAWNQTLAPGATFSRAFPVAGTFDFKCTIHPAMNGSVIVK